MTMRFTAAVAAMACVCGPAFGNDWQKFYHPVQDASSAIPWSGPPEIIAGSGNLPADVDGLWRRGFAVVGYSAFNSPNNKTADAIKWGAKLRARYVLLGTDLASSQTTVLPLTLPNTTTSTTTGNVSAYGSGGVGNANFSATTTHYGTQTSYIPITVNRFDKLAVYFVEVPKKGTGIFPRDLTAAEIATLETQRAIAVRAVRDGSPAYEANILPGDVIVAVDGNPADPTNWQAAVQTDPVLHVKLIRNGQPREVLLTVPAEWRPN